MNKEILEQQLKLDKPIVLDFWAPWCAPCLHFGPTFSATATDYSHAVFGKINVVENEDLAVKFKVRSIPKVCIIVHGEIIAESHGALSSEDFKDFLNEHLS
jgi:thioredoxin